MEKPFLENQEIEPEKNRLEQNEENEEKEKSEDERLMSRRNFLKKAGLALGTMAVGGAGLKKFFEEPDSESEIPEYEAESEIEEKEDESESEAERRIENLADHYLQAFSELSKSDKLFPGEIFKKDLLIALQCQESRGKIDAKSKSGALGVMQNMSVSIIDVTTFLNRLRRNTDFDWSGPENLSSEDMDEINALITQKSDYGRAFGKLYLMMLWNKEYGYSVGRKPAAHGDVKAAQIELLGSYNAGYRRIRGKSYAEWKKLREKYRKQKSEEAQKEFRAYNEAIEYVEKIFKYKERLKMIRKEFKQEEIEFDNNVDYAARELSLKLDEYKDRESALKNYSDKFKQININEKRKISYRDIDLILKS